MPFLIFGLKPIFNTALTTLIFGDCHQVKSIIYSGSLKTLAVTTPVCILLVPEGLSIKRSKCLPFIAPPTSITSHVDLFPLLSVISILVPNLKHFLSAAKE
jgi:hypothetical protein